MGKLQSDLQRWSSLYLSLVGRVNCIKMNVLPRFLYLFQCLPVFLSNSFFQTLSKLTSSFLWDGKSPRIPGNSWRDPETKVASHSPILNYYWASNIPKVIALFQTPGTEWCRVEVGFCKSSSLSALVTANLPFSPSQYMSSPVVSSTLKIWAQLWQKSKLMNFFVYSPICNSHLFPAASLDHTFTQWLRVGLDRCCDLYLDRLFGSFIYLTAKFGLDIFRYLQVRHLVQCLSPTFPILPAHSGLEDILLMPVQYKSQILKMVLTVTSLQMISLDKIKREWVEELGTDISDAAWDCAQSRVNDTSSCAHLSLIQFKILHQIYYAKSKLSKIYPDVEHRCNCCNSTLADMSHVLDMSKVKMVLVIHLQNFDYCIPDQC